ncbi:MAG: nucleotide exchange factor GrpE [Clostridia bacterium]|nr:nucleotide exchange factor GrpE [Clostridia bacterium]
MSKKKNGKEPEVKEQETTAEQPQDEGCTLTKEEMEKVRQHVEELQKKLDETVNLLQRNQADFDNFRRRNATVRADSYEEGKRDAITALLPILDDFDRVAESEPKDEKWAEGVSLVHRKLTETLQKQGLSEVETDGDFDPNLHNAVMAEAAEGVEKGKILAVFQKGYRVKDKIVRHSMVKVSE